MCMLTAVSQSPDWGTRRIMLTEYRAAKDIKQSVIDLSIYGGLVLAGNETENIHGQGGCLRILNYNSFPATDLALALAGIIYINHLEGQLSPSVHNSRIRIIILPDWGLSYTYFSSSVVCYNCGW